MVKANEHHASPPPSQPWSRRRALGLGGGVVLIVCIGVTISTSQSPSEPEAVTCGWDLSTQEGIDANNAYLTASASWIASRPQTSSELPPPPTSPYWRGECPRTEEQPTADPFFHEEQP
jgi:hypothetical protein